VRLLPLRDGGRIDLQQDILSERRPDLGYACAFATYSVGFFARPLGGIVFGHFGARIGRKSMLLVTLLMMGVPTILIGLIPSYESIGYWAAALLVLMRIIQGLAVGGDWGGAVLMAVEHAPEGKKCFFGSLPQAGVASGSILSSLAMTSVAGLSEKDMLAWGWRISFLASVALLASVGSSE
jgi:MHS family shikimate/dehydroshikimate transporter-like MFS transporter